MLSCTLERLKPIRHLFSLQLISWGLIAFYLVPTLPIYGRGHYEKYVEMVDLLREKLSPANVDKVTCRDTIRLFSIENNNQIL